MSRKLVAYFSVSGTTAQVAEKLAEAIGADIFAIEPEIPYTQADLNWMNKNARSTIEMNAPDSRPAITAKRDNMAEYDVIFVGFPIWWHVAPTVINTLLESYDLSSKVIVPFAISGGSGSSAQKRLWEQTPGISRCGVHFAPVPMSYRGGRKTPGCPSFRTGQSQQIRSRCQR